MVFFPRRQFEWFLGAALVIATLWMLLLRVGGMADETNRQALITAGAHFSAGVAMLQAKSRATGGAGLNRLGYPAAAHGSVSTDLECLDIWRNVMNDEGAQVIAHVVVSADAAGNRCEYRLDLQTAPPGRVMYWPLGTVTGIAAVDGREVEVMPGEHVHVDLGEARTMLPL